MTSDARLDHPAQQVSPDPTIQDYLGAVLRGKWIILGALSLVVLCAAAYILVSSPVYRATATILIDLRSVHSSLFLDAMNFENEKNIIQNEIEVLKSYSLAEEVARRLLERDVSDPVSRSKLLIIQPPADADSADLRRPAGFITARIRKDVDVDAVPATDVITITASSKDPREAALLANLVADVYEERNIEVTRLKSRSFREFLEAQLQEKRQTLALAEDSLQRYMQSSGIVSLDDESKKLVDRLSRLEAERDEATIMIRSLTTTLASYQGVVSKQEKDVAEVIGQANDPYIRLLQEQLARLEVQRDVTIAQNPATVGQEIYSTKMKEIESQIGVLRGKLQKRTSEFLHSLLPSATNSSESRDAAGYLQQVKQKMAESQMDLGALRAKKAALDNAIGEYDRQFSRIPRRSVDFARLQRSRASTEKLYLAIQEKYNEAMMTEQSQFGYVSIIDRAAVPRKPASPNVLLLLVAAVVIGSGAGLGIVFVREKIDVKIHSPEELKRYGFTVLGSVMRVNGVRTTRTFPLRRRKLPVAVAGRAAKSGTMLLSLTKPFSSGAESYRHLRTNLHHARRDGGIRTHLVTSAKPGEGKSTTVANLAVVFAQSGKKVLLVDADLRKPSLHGLFGAPREPGLSELLSQSGDHLCYEDYFHATGIDNLDLLTCGALPGNPAELLESDRMRRFLEEMRRRYDSIFLDSSPVLAGTDPTILSTLADGVIVVASAGETRFNELKQTLELLAAVSGSPPAVVLNKFDLRQAYGIPYGQSGFGYYHYSQQA